MGTDIEAQIAGLDKLGIKTDQTALAPRNAVVDENRAQQTEPLPDSRYHWSGENFGHLAFLVEDIYALCDKLQKGGVTINRPPRDGHMAFVRSPDNISIELLQKGDALPPNEPWQSMPNTGEW